MFKLDLTNPIYSDNDKAREHLEAIMWPHGPVCPRCQVSGDRITKLKGKSTRPGVYKCKDCRKPFSVTVGTVMERSKIPLTKWLLAAQLKAASKKGISAKQLERMLGITYESAWFLTHRLNEAATPKTPGPIGGSNKVVEADETYIGGKARNKAFGPPPKKMAVLTFVEREGESRSFHVPNVTAKTLRPLIVKTADRKSHLMTDESPVYPKVGREFAGHSAVNHSKDEYARAGGFIHSNTAESYFAILKRGIYGTFHSISEAHLHRYLAEFDFRYAHRKMSDTETTIALLKAAAGKRLMYHQPREAGHA
ncbi:IS1595 family transposase [Nisaea sp.]|uniref:IS1595 family transposase n=1 Tax=Nisaea sp. TaxID=2024842 RepID=UPI0032EB9AC8